MKKPDMVKITVKLPKKSVEDIKELAKLGGITMTQVVQNAIVTESFFADQLKSGKTILVEDGLGIIQQIVFVDQP
jgi:hypothetical protein